MIFRKLTQINNNYEVNAKVIFGKGSKVDCDGQDFKQAFLFSWNMTFGATGEHRSYRSGGQVIRNNIQKFCDVFIGKLGEVAFYNLLKKRKGVNKITEIDYECYGLGKWDSSDFVINDKHHIAVKTTKNFGNLLLLEEKDWIVREGQAIYVPNQHSESKGIYEFLFFSRVKTNIHEILKKIDFQQYQIIDSLHSLFFSQIISLVQVELEVVGYVLNMDLVKMIDEKYILPQNSILNGKTRMDASNYYLQSGFFRNISIG